MSTNINKIIIDIRCMINYASYYIYGLKKLGYDVEFSMIEDRPFIDDNDYRKGFAMLIKYINGAERKVFVDTNDDNNIDEKYYEWSDLYAKINLNPQDIDRSKVLPIGPSFGVTLWNPLHTMLYGFRNYHKWKGDEYKVPIKMYIKDYMYTVVRRKPYNTYHCRCEEDNDYVFTLSTLWYSVGCYKTTNVHRGAYARACKDVFSKFEGGFFYIDSPVVFKECPKYADYLKLYGDMIVYKRISMKEYLDKTKKSLFVFNTPSVVGCHGWKMAEYLAMGKAIISTPILNAMPGEFTKDVHYLEASTPEEIKEAVLLLKNNPDKVKSLKENAKLYFEQYLSPEAVVTRILEKAETIC